MLKAGAARYDLSPRYPMFLIGYPHMPRLSTGIHDPLHASALFLDDGRTSLLLIGVDLLYVGADTVVRCRTAIYARTGISPAHILISATHTHSGPMTTLHLAFRRDPVVPAAVDGTYLAWVEDRIVTAAVEAWKNRTDAELAVTTATIEGVGTNRLDPNGPADSEAGILVLRRASDHIPLALDVVYSMHPTVLHEDSTLVSADFPGAAMMRLIETFPGLVPIYHTGPSGNQSPRWCVKAQTFEEAERLGGLLADRVREAVHALRPEEFQHEVVLKAVSSTVRLEPRRFPSIEQARANRERTRTRYQKLRLEGAPHGLVRTAECEVFGAEEGLVLAEAQASGELRQWQERYQTAEVQVFRIGPVCLVGVPGEVFVEYGLEIKARATRRSFIISLANGECQGYIVTPEAEQAGGYEAQCGLFTAVSGRRLVEKAMALIGEVA
jgi:hypothetical protein